MLKYHDTNPLGTGRSHVSIGLEYAKLGTEIALDIQCPTGISKSLPKDLLAFFETLGKSDAGPTVKRSSKWAKFSKSLIEKQPYCSLCGNKEVKSLVCHHIVPVWVDPSLELDEENAVVLCENSGKLGGFNCHLQAGHLGNYRLWNPRIREVSTEVLKHIQQGTIKYPSDKK